MNGTRDTNYRDSFFVVPEKRIQGGYAYRLGEGRGDDERDVLLSFLEQGGGFERGGDEVLPYVE